MRYLPARTAIEAVLVSVISRPVGILAGPDGVRVSQEEVAATLYVLYSPQVADMLMGDYAWSPERYERWLVQMILHAVLM